MTDKTMEALQCAYRHAESFLTQLDDQPVGPTIGLEELRRRVDNELRDEGLDPVQVIDELVRDVSGGVLGNAGGRFFAWVIGGALPSALAADWLTSTFDQNAALCAVSPAMAVTEEVAGRWLKELLDLPMESSFALTTGCQMAHFTALAAARHAVLAKAGWDMNRDGLFGAPRIRVLTSDCRHGSVDRACRFLGIGARDLVSVQTDDRGCIEESAFTSALQDGEGPTIVVLDAADLNIGAFDAFQTLIPLAQAAGAWVHVDGAFGLIARASRSKKALLEGVELADSWATDGHKWLNVPFDCGIAIVRDAEAHRAAMTVSASYIAAEGFVRDEIDWNPEWSRRGRGLSLYAALREMGRQGVEDLIDRTCALAATLVAGIGELPGVEVLWQPHLNQGLVRFLDEREGAEALDHDERTHQIIGAVNDSGEAYFSGTTWRGMKAMRVSVVNWRTNDRDIERTIAAVAKALQSQ